MEQKQTLRPSEKPRSVGHPKIQTRPKGCATRLLSTRQIIVYCRTCDRYHYHGVTDQRTPYVTHLMAHCGRGPLNGTGYHIFVKGYAPPAVIRDARRRRSRWFSDDEVGAAHLAAYEARNQFLGWPPLE